MTGSGGPDRASQVFQRCPQQVHRTLSPEWAADVELCRPVLGVQSDRNCAEYVVSCDKSVCWPPRHELPSEAPSFCWMALRSATIDSTAVPSGTPWQCSTHLIAQPCRATGLPCPFVHLLTHGPPAPHTRLPCSQSVAQLPGQSPVASLHSRIPNIHACPSSHVWEVAPTAGLTLPVSKRDESKGF